MLSRGRSFSWVGLVLSLACAFSSVRAEEDDPDFTVTDADKVYYGKGKHPESPAVIKADDVWAEIPEYKKIVEDDLDEDDAEYHILMKKATERFEKALKDEAKREDHDLIAEVGAVKSNNGKKIPDATKDLIELVTR